MSPTLPETGLQLQSCIRSDATLELSLAEVPVADPGEGEVLVRVEAAPINPSDMGLLFGPADMTSARASGSPDRPVVTADVPKHLLASVAARLDQALPCGNEGAGVVVAAGSSEAAQALLGRTVALLGGGLYAQYRTAPAGLCLALPKGTTSAQGASCFVNPLTALGMVETMKLEGHTALVHTAAASNLGQMLVKLCLADDVPLVNIVRKPEQVDLLSALGAKFICDSSTPNFRASLVDALAETGATLAFDATGGGDLASQILSAMETALGRNATEYSRYGSETHKQVYLYGGLERSKTRLDRTYGMAWGVGGWLLPPFLKRVGFAAVDELRQRVAREIITTFASQYTREVSLAEALQLDSIALYGRQATGEKLLVNPSLAR
ncbi:MAG: zinc-binding dehydrogenase [Myxococcota bacterium]|jgi:NADPH:quinone reductase-like Zn-dependent oxidoreductase